MTYSFLDSQLQTYNYIANKKKMNEMATVTSTLFKGVVEDYEIELHSTHELGTIRIQAKDKFEVYYSTVYTITERETILDTVNIVVGIIKELATMYHFGALQKSKELKGDYDVN